MNKDLYKEIDSCVKELLKNGLISENGSNSVLRSEAITYLKSKCFIKPSNKRFQYVPNSEIYDIREVGIEKYLKNKQSDNEIESDIRKITLFNLKSKYFINFIFIVFSAYLGWLSKSFYLKKGKKHTIEKVNKVISGKNDSISHFQTRLNEKNKIIFSLKRQIDSLKLIKQKP